LEAGIELILQLITGIVNSYAKVIEVGAEIIQKVKEGFSEKIKEAAEWGRDLLQNFIDGIKSKLGDLRGAVGNIAATIKKLIGFSEPEEGALSNFHTFAPDMMDLFASGIKSNANNVFSAVDDVADGIYDSFQTTPALEIAGGYGTMNAEAGMSDNDGYGDVVTAITDALMNMQLMVNIGNRPIEAMITGAQQRTTYRSGGR